MYGTKLGSLFSETPEFCDLDGTLDVTGLYLTAVEKSQGGIRTNGEA